MGAGVGSAVGGGAVVVAMVVMAATVVVASTVVVVVLVGGASTVVDVTGIAVVAELTEDLIVKNTTRLGFGFRNFDNCRL